MSPVLDGLCYDTSVRATLPVARLKENKRMSLLGFLIIGIVAGWLAGVIMKGSGYGVIGDLVIGVIGAFIGGHVLGWFGFVAGGTIASLFAALVGAIILILIVRLIKRA
jgi:uncharacterized membrane protein YeaQ/YmgE (transglycosylase-associated protein family)